MGFFSWKFADSGNMKRLKIGRPAYLMCPDGSSIYTGAYDGYGHFGSYDVYELAAEWNRPFLNGFPVKTCATVKGQIEDYAAGKSDAYMRWHYGCDWKRDIGIDIACSDENNRRLKFPVKICRNNVIPYQDLPASLSDPMQGCD